GPDDLPPGGAACRRAGRGGAGEPGRPRLPEPALRPALHRRAARERRGPRRRALAAGRIGDRPVSLPDRASLSEEAPEPERSTISASPTSRSTGRATSTSTT